jgi:hypothetical protein
LRKGAYPLGPFGGFNIVDELLPDFIHGLLFSDQGREKTVPAINIPVKSASIHPCKKSVHHYLTPNENKLS